MCNCVGARTCAYMCMHMCVQACMHKSIQSECTGIQILVVSSKYIWQVSDFASQLPYRDGKAMQLDGDWDLGAIWYTVLFV
jgi:hypothetical protein